MKKNVLFFIIIFSISSVNKANAISPGPIIKTFKGIGKFFKKSADEVPDIGKKIEDFKSGNLKSGGKIDESISSLDNTNSIQFEEGTLSQIDNFSNDELLDAHNIKNKKRKMDADQVLDVIDAIDTADVIVGTASIIPFIEQEWQGKVFINSKYFNDPNLEKRILIKCETSLEDYYFTVLFNKKEGNWLLLSGNFTNKKKGLYINPMKRQELLVLKDLNEYLYFSNKPKGIKKYPTKYFIINDEAKFLYSNNLSETKSPDFFIKDLLIKIKKSSFKCKRTL